MLGTLTSTLLKLPLRSLTPEKLGFQITSNSAEQRIGSIIQAFRHGYRTALDSNSMAQGATPAISGNFTSGQKVPIDRPTSNSTEPLSSTDGRKIASDLYEHLLFHTHSFQKVESYLSAKSDKTSFQIRPECISDQRAIDTLTRDAFIHGIQICVPDELLLPSSVESIRSFRCPNEARLVSAKERSSRGGKFVYDIIATDCRGELVEQWTGLTLTRYRRSTLPKTAHSLIHEISESRMKSHRSRNREQTPRHYVYEHNVCFKDTNLVGNVYFTNHLEWQGRCREQFLRDHVPKIFPDIQSGQLAIVTVSCSCDYKSEITAFDVVEVRMSLTSAGDDWAMMQFEYWASNNDAARLIAIGYQKIATRVRSLTGLSPTPLPAALRDALQEFSSL